MSAHALNRSQQQQQLDTAVTGLRALQQEIRGTAAAVVEAEMHRYHRCLELTRAEITAALEEGSHARATVATLALVHRQRELRSDWQANVGRVHRLCHDTMVHVRSLLLLPSPPSGTAEQPDADAVRGLLRGPAAKRLRGGGLVVPPPAAHTAGIIQGNGGEEDPSQATPLPFPDVVEALRRMDPVLDTVVTESALCPDVGRLYATGHIA